VTHITTMDLHVLDRGSNIMLEFVALLSFLSIAMFQKMAIFRHGRNVRLSVISIIQCIRVAMLLRKKTLLRYPSPASLVLHDAIIVQVRSVPEMPC
jgi:hypothetical protein